MGKVIELDESQSLVTFHFQDKEFDMLPMTADVWVKWNALRHKQERITRHIQSITSKLEATDLADEQRDSFEDKIEALQSDEISLQLDTLRLMLSGLDDETARQLSTIQRAKIMAVISRAITEAYEDINKEFGASDQGESTTP
jgi:hypothetical protein